MTRVTSSEHVLLLLREQLQRLDRTRGGRTGRAGGSGRPTPAPLARLQSLGGLDVADNEFKRTLVRALLSERMGEGVANDPAFQTVIDDVYRIINGSDEGRALIDRAARRLRGG